ncbi:hypothetical protein JOM56_014647 [Amanita muscaria]
MLPPLPQPFREEKWLKEGINTFLRWAALQLYPWHLTDEQLLDGLANTCHVLYGTTARNYVHRYCDSFGVAALSAVNEYFERHAKRFKDQFVLLAHFAHDQLMSHRFLYGKSDGHDPFKWRGSFRGPLIIATLVHHFQQIDNVRMEPRLTPGAWRSLPRAALAISAAAVEHALILQASAKLDLSVDGDHSARIAAVLKSWHEVWQENTVPYLALVACLEDRDVRRACQAAFQMYEDSA